MERIVLATVQGGCFFGIEVDKKLQKTLKELCAINAIADIDYFENLANVSFCSSYEGENIQCFSLHKAAKEIIENDLNSVTIDDIEYFALSAGRRLNLMSKMGFESFKFVNNLGNMNNIREMALKEITLNLKGGSLIIKATSTAGEAIESDSISTNYLTI